MAFLFDVPEGRKAEDIDLASISPMPLSLPGMLLGKVAVKASGKGLDKVMERLFKEISVLGQEALQKSDRWVNALDFAQPFGRDTFVKEILRGVKDAVRFSGQINPVKELKHFLLPHRTATSKEAAAAINLAKRTGGLENLIQHFDPTPGSPSFLPTPGNIEAVARLEQFLSKVLKETR